MQCLVAGESCLIHFAMPCRRRVVSNLFCNALSQASRVLFILQCLVAGESCLIYFAMPCRRRVVSNLFCTARVFVASLFVMSNSGFPWVKILLQTIDSLMIGCGSCVQFRQLVIWVGIIFHEDITETFIHIFWNTYKIILILLIILLIVIVIRINFYL